MFFKTNLYIFMVLVKTQYTFIYNLKSPSENVWNHDLYAYLSFNRGPWSTVVHFACKAEGSVDPKDPGKYQNL